MDNQAESNQAHRGKRNPVAPMRFQALHFPLSRLHGGFAESRGIDRAAYETCHTLISPRSSCSLRNFTAVSWHPSVCFNSIAQIQHYGQLQLLCFARTRVCPASPCARHFILRADFASLR
ncbi:hypothetical protein BAUCODRAFT_458771 [Baudoinia panamericana UAMH 10762]|uniref:Uncharacterized protein n=1 Tax=Baudoinia panamericana (strain UAMH 10762) TaxID=717646 RepID=M2NF36_BAUPA|nr:uncharacterized protein BAUCODRAFT_458771 [Baudoinia panamericana UAMH 10762]EMC97580.1 hypothetical protein BAUCODRAFT_458771 [Baudoinia panamericana UAMH 10762]